MRHPRLPAIAMIVVAVFTVATLVWSLWWFSWTTVYASGYSRTRIGLLSRLVIDVPAHAAPGGPPPAGVVNVPALAGTIALTAMALVMGLHFVRQTCLNHGPRDQCCTCGARQSIGGNDIHCPRCGEWPNRRRSPWAFWRLFVTRASPLWRLVTGAGRTSYRTARKAATDNRLTRARAEKLEISEICPKCGYDLHRNSSPNCPECGYERQYVARA